MKLSIFDVTISVLGVAISPLAQSFRRYWRGVSGNIRNFGVGITPMCNRVTNHGDMGIFLRPAGRAEAGPDRLEECR